MKPLMIAALCGLAWLASPVGAQDDSGLNEVVVTGSLMRNSLSATSPIAIPQPQPPVIGLKRQADSAVRAIEIVSDSREAGLRKREVQAMLLDAIDRAKRGGMSLVTGQFELVEVTRDNWRDQFPGLGDKPVTDEDEDDDEDNDDSVGPAFDDDGANAAVRLKVKTKLDGSIGNAQEKITNFVKSVPVTGRSQIVQRGGLALTIVNPEQYRDEIYRRIAAGAKQAVGFYGPEYGLEVTGLDNAIGWKQVSNTEVFLYIPYQFVVEK